jgi:hypothetical protein
LGRCLRDGLLDKSNTASSVWADTAYRSAANEEFEEFMERNGFVSHVHRKKPKGRPMPEAMRRANNAKSKIRSRVEHVFRAEEPEGRDSRTANCPAPGIYDSMGNCNAKRRLCATLKSECPINGTAAYC